MEKSRQAFAFCLSVLTAILNPGCKESPAESAGDSLSPLMNLAAFSADSTTVGLTWALADGFETSTMLDQFIKITSGAALIDSISLPFTARAVSVPNLTEGVTYTFTASIRITADSIHSSALPISWSPAKRLSLTPSGQPLRLYESNSSLARGIRFFSDSLNSTMIIPLGSAEHSLIDVYFNSSLKLESGSLAPPGGRTTQFSTQTMAANSLNTGQQSPPATATYTSTGVVIDGEPAASGVIAFARTQDNHYARILILRGPGNIFVQGNAPNRYIEVQISYQSTPFVLYAMPASPPRGLIPHS